MVRSAIALGRPPQKVIEKSPPISVAKTFTNSAKSVGKFLNDLDAQVTKATAVDKAIGPSKQTFSTEKMVIDSALKMARTAAEIEAKLAADPNLRKRFDTAHEKLEGLLKNRSAKHGHERAAEVEKIDILPITTPAKHSDSAINAAILIAHMNLIGDRARYFDDVRLQLSKDPRLSPHVQRHLESLGCQGVWAEISRKKELLPFESFVRALEAKRGDGSQS